MEYQHSRPACKEFGQIGLAAQVCDHPDLFEPRPIVSSFDLPRIEQRWPSLALNALGGTLLAPDIPGLPAWTQLQLPGSTSLMGHEGAQVGCSPGSCGFPPGL